MKVKELIEKLQSYNQEAETSVIVHNHQFPYSLSFGGPEGVENKNTDEVHFYVDKLNDVEVVTHHVPGAYEIKKD